MKSVLFLAILLSFVSFAPAQPAAEASAPLIAEIFLAKANPDGKAGEAAESFLITDVPIFCVVRFNAPGVASVRMDLSVADVPGVKAGSKPIVSTSYTTKADEDRVNFRGRPQGNWVAGRYRVEIFVGDKKVRNIEFDVKSGAAEAAKPGVVKTTRKPSKRTTSTEAVSRRTYSGALN